MLEFPSILSIKNSVALDILFIIWLKWSIRQNHRPLLPASPRSCSCPVQLQTLPCYSSASARKDIWTSKVSGTSIQNTTRRMFLCNYTSLDKNMKMFRLYCSWLESRQTGSRVKCRSWFASWTKSTSQRSASCSKIHPWAVRTLWSNLMETS